MPHLVEMVKKFSPDEFVMLGIDTTNRPEMSREYVESVGADWPHLMDDMNVAGGDYKVLGVPTNVFIDQDGRAMFRSVGFRPGDERFIEETVSAMVKRAKNSG